MEIGAELIGTELELPSMDKLLGEGPLKPGMGPGISLKPLPLQGSYGRLKHGIISTVDTTII